MVFRAIIKDNEQMEKKGVSFVELSNYVMAEIDANLADALAPIYNKYLKEHVGLEFKSYYQQSFAETWNELRNLMEVTTETITAVAKRREMTKRRWLTKEFKDGNRTGLQRELEMLLYWYEKQNENSVGSVDSIYGVSTFEEAKEKAVNKLKEWGRNQESLLCSFPYLNDKSPAQIESAFKNDGRYLLIKNMIAKYPKGEKGTVVSMPNSITSFPYDPTNRVRISGMELENQHYKEVYYINDKTRFESRLKVDAIQEGLMQENLKLLNSTDHDILFYLMSMNHEALYQPIPMVVEIGEIVRSVYDTDGKKNYLSVKESLIKMDFMELRVIDESTLRSTKVEIFSKVTIEMDEVSEREVARIIFSEDLIHEFVKNQTVSIYKKIIDSFKLNSTKVLIYPLQRQRIYSASLEPEGENIFFKTNLSFFRGALVFGNSKRSAQIKVIEKALDEIISNKITLKSYQRIGDNFKLEFYPFTETEKRDLLSNNAPEKFLLTRTNNTIE